MNAKKIIIALDEMDSKDALVIAKKLKNKVWGFKVNDLLIKDSLIIKKLKKYGKVFADVKLHDIPNTVGNSVKRLSEHGADFITVHAVGGIPMMKSAKQNAGKSKIIAVTILTSNKLKSKKEFIKLIEDALKSDVAGIVSSGHELKIIDQLIGSKKLLKVVPGIRPSWYKTKDDQNRIMTAKEAFELGADYLVIGRPITKSRNVLEALELICRE